MKDIQHNKSRRQDGRPPGTRRSGNGIPDLKGGGALVELGGPLAGPCNLDIAVLNWDALDKDAHLNGLWGIATGFAPGFTPGGGLRGTASKV